MSQQSQPRGHASNSSITQSVASSKTNDSAASAFKQAGTVENQKDTSNNIPRYPSVSSRKAAPSSLNSSALDLKSNSVGSAPPTPPPTHPIPPIPSPTTSEHSDETRDARIAGNQEDVRNGSSVNRGLGISDSEFPPQEAPQQGFAKQALSEDSSASNPPRSRIQSRLAKQGRSSAKSVASEASTDTFGNHKNDEVPPPLPPPLPAINALNFKNLEAVSSSANRSSKLGGYGTRQPQFGRNSDGPELQLDDSDYDEDDDDYDGYSDDEVTEQAHSSTLGSDLQTPRQLSSRESRSPRSKQGGFPLPPPRVESLDSEKAKWDREESYDERRLRTSSLQKPSTPQSSTFQERLAQMQAPPLSPRAATRRTLGSLSSQPQSAALSRSLSSQPQAPALSRRPSNFAAKTSASSSMTEIPASDGRRRANQSSENGHGDFDSDDEKGFYKRSTQRSNLADWAPNATPAQGSFGIANLPDWDTLRAGEPTSKPISQVKRDMDWSLKRLISPQVFEQVLQDQLGRHKFREFLVRSQGSEAKLDMLFDLTQYSKSIAAIKATAEAVHDIYLAGESPNHQDLPTEIDNQVFGSLKKTFELKVSLDDAQSHLLQSLFQNEFQSFIKNQIIETTKVKLGESIDPNDLDGLGNCYCLTNPRLRENPIVLISDGFTAVTGYSRQAIIGRNCRFLQGPSTSDAAVDRIRQALNNAEPITELLLNYRKDGTPFFCLLNIIPLRESSGKLAYFIGGQTNVTGTLANSRGLSFLVSSNHDTDIDTEMPTKNGVEISATMARHLGISHAAGMASIETSSILSGASGGRHGTRSESGGKTGRAAGSYNPAVHDPMPMGTMLDPQIKNPTKKGGFFKMFGGKSNGASSTANKKQSLNAADGDDLGQRLEGAEMKDLRSREANTLEEQMDFFTQQSSKLLILRRQKREVLFATGELISFFGLPTDTTSQLLSSSLVHADFLSLLCGADKNETKALRAKVSHSISKGDALNLEVGIRQPSKKRFGSSPNDKVIKYTTLFLTPLKDRENANYALVALFA